MDATDNSRRRAEAQAVTEQATEWLMRLEEQGAQANAAFADWLRESPTHVQAYLRATTLDTVLKRMDPQRSWEITKPIPGRSTPDIEPGYAPVHPRRLWRLAASIAAVGILSAASLTVWKLTGNSRQTYRTGVGEQRSVQLSDGSMITLNTASRVEVHFTTAQRELQLLEGEAVFRAARDAARPFRVRSGDSVVQAIGTEFNIYRKKAQTSVSVIEGRVAVIASSATRTSPVYLNAGEALRLDGQGVIPRKSSADVKNVTAWREHRLVFVDEPLSSIAYEVNRYNRSPKIRVDGAAAQRRYAVNLQASDPESLIAVLTADPKIAVERREGEIRVFDR